MLIDQDFGCWICRCTEAEAAEKHRNGFVIDHDHKTDEVRGILCHHCNTMIGLAKDDVANLAAGIQYLSRAAYV